MRTYAESKKVLFHKDRVYQGVAYDVVEVQSKSNPAKKYVVDLTHGRCSCPAWIFQKGGERKPCKHLKGLGFVQTYFKPVEIAEPPKVGERIAEVA